MTLFRSNPAGTVRLNRPPPDVRREEARGRSMLVSRTINLRLAVFCSALALLTAGAMIGILFSGGEDEWKLLKVSPFLLGSAVLILYVLYLLTVKTVLTREGGTVTVFTGCCGIGGSRRIQVGRIVAVRDGNSYEDDAECADRIEVLLTGGESLFFGGALSGAARSYIAAWLAAGAP